MGSPEPERMTRQREVGAAAREETKRRLLAAAAEEFAERGYVGATVTRIAEGAGVTVQTLYLAWGSKRALLRAYMEQALAGTSGLPPANPLSDAVVAQMPASNDPRTVVADLAALHRRIGERAALGWQLYRDAAVADADVAGDWLENQRLRHVTYGRIMARLPLEALRPGLTHESAADTAWALASPECWDLLIRRRGYTLDEYEAWVEGTLGAALLHPSLLADGRE
jgi:AcrR family transcriptional regulator